MENNRQNSTNINWYPGHMAKTKRELKEMIDLIDIVYEVIDARMPISSKIVDIDDIIKNKPRILIVTKYDMCDKNETDKILNSYTANGYKLVTCDLIKGIGIKNIIEETKNLFKPVNDERLKKGLKPRKARVLVVGVPNVGKSTLINKLVGKKAVQVGDKPGITKSTSWIRISSDIELLDSPGILWPKIENQEHAYNLAALSSIKEEIVDKENLANYIIIKLKKLYPEYLLKRYSLKKLDLDTIYDDIAESKGMYLKGGMFDYDKVCNTLINDLKSGALGNITFDRFC